MDAGKVQEHSKIIWLFVIEYIPMYFRPAIVKFTNHIHKKAELKLSSLEKRI